MSKMLIHLDGALAVQNLGLAKLIMLWSACMEVLSHDIFQRKKKISLARSIVVAQLMLRDISLESNDLFRKDVVINDDIWKKVVAYKKLVEENSRLIQWGVLKNQVLFVKSKQAAKFSEEKHLKRTKLMSQITNYRQCKDLKTYCARYDYFRCYDTVNDSCECSDFHTYKYCKHQHRQETH